VQSVKNEDPIKKRKLKQSSKEVKVSVVVVPPQIKPETSPFAGTKISQQNLEIGIDGSKESVTSKPKKLKNLILVDQSKSCRKSKASTEKEYKPLLRKRRRRSVRKVAKDPS